MKKTLFFTVFVLLIISGAVYMFLSQRSYQNVNLVVDNPSGKSFKATIHRIDSENHEGDYTSGLENTKPITEVSESIVVNLRPGNYLVVSKGNVDFEDMTTEFSVQDKPIDVVLKPSFTSAVLENELVRQRDKIVSALRTTSPNATNFYSIDIEKLYQQGGWFGGTLVPKNSSDQQLAVDVLRFVAQKQSNGSWRIVTNPPELLLSHVKYPNIPREILLDLNRQ